MLTVGALIEQLARLDPGLPVGVIDIDRNPRSQRLVVALRAVTDIDTTHDPTSGAARAVWLTAQPIAEGDGLGDAEPATVVVPSYPCGCLIALYLIDGRRCFNLDAIACAHHEPNEIVLRSARRLQP